MLTLQQYVTIQRPASPELPAVRVDTAKAFRLTVSSNVIREKDAICDVYHESLLYFNYGRNAYRPPTDNRPNSLKNKAPICIIADLRKLPEPIRVAAVDTGGMPYYSNLDNFRFSADDFMIPSTRDAPARAVTAFFGSNQNYLHAKARRLPEAEVAIEVLALHKLISSGVVSAADDRSSAIELQYRDGIPNEDGVIIGVVAPDHYASDGQFIDWCRAYSIKPFFYTYIRNWRDGERYGMMTGALLSAYRSFGILR